VGVATDRRSRIESFRSGRRAPMISGLRGGAFSREHVAVKRSILFRAQALGCVPRRFCLAELRDVTDKTFGAEVLESAVPVLVDFWGDHCAACREISPILRDLAVAYEGRLRIVKIHAAENPSTSAKYAIRAMPTVLVFAGGEVVGQLVGARPKAAFVEAIGRVL
jgi:thioredoxin